MYGWILQIIVILIGLGILTLAIVMLARKKLEANACVTWGFVAAMMIVAGIILRPDGWIQYLSPAGMVLILLVAICFFAGMFRISSALSFEVRKTNELAMQVSLQNHEIEILQNRVEELEKQLETAGADAVKKPVSVP